MNQIKDVFEDIRKNLIGLNSCYIKVGYGGNLRFGLGEKIYYNKPCLKNKFYGEWDISTLFCSWRISNGRNIRCGYDDDIKYSNDILMNVDIGSIIELECNSGYDLKFLFDTGYIIDCFLQSTNGMSLSIINANNSLSYELFSTGWEVKSSKESFQKLTKIEELLSDLSENCHSRWAQIVPYIEIGSKCNECFYFRGLDGYFYFWDYGICSNEKSDYDGKLVGISSGCNCFEKLSDKLRDI